MSNIYMPDTSNTKRKFILLYIVTILIICAAVSAFIIRPQTKVPTTIGSNMPLINNEFAILNQLNAKWSKLNVDRGLLVKAQADNDSAIINTAQQQLVADRQLLLLSADSLLQIIPSENLFLNHLVNHYKQLANLPLQPVAKVINGDMNEAVFARQLKIKNDEITRLKQRLQSNVGNTFKPTSSNTKDEVKFLKWALSSQSGEVSKLRKENILLKNKIK